MNYIVVTFCPAVRLLSTDMLDRLFKMVKYSEDGTCSAGVVELTHAELFGLTDEDGKVIAKPLIDQVNGVNEVVEILAYADKDKQGEMWDSISDDGAAKIRLVHPQFITIQDEDGEDVIIERGLAIGALA